MKTIKFNKITYNLVNELNVTATYLQATIEKGSDTFDAIIADTVNCNEITVKEDSAVIAVYNGYTKRIAISIHEDDLISIELANTDIEEQINILQAKQNTQANAIESMDNDISNINTNISEITDGQATQDLAIGDLGEAVSELSEV